MPRPVFSPHVGWGEGRLFRAREPMWQTPESRVLEFENDSAEADHYRSGAGLQARHGR